MCALVHPSGSKISEDMGTEDFFYYPHYFKGTCKGLGLVSWVKVGARHFILLVSVRSCAWKSSQSLNNMGVCALLC